MQKHWPNSQTMDVPRNQHKNASTLNYYYYCDVFDWRPSLPGNHSHSSSMDMLTSPVLLPYMVTNIRKASVSIVAGSVKGGKTIHRVSLRQSASEVSLWDQCVSESSSVSLQNQRSAVLTVNYRRRKPVLRRVSVVSGVRPLSLYLVVLVS
jgi:hypothetical protein